MKRLRKDLDILKEYDAGNCDQIEKGIVEEVNDTSETNVSKVYETPYHVVIRRYKATTKLKTVYDASIKANGPLLNNRLHSNSALTQNIVDILIQLTHKVTLIADIEKAFPMVSVAKQDRDVLRFQWPDDIDKGCLKIVTLRSTYVNNLTSGSSENDAVYEQYQKAKLRLAERGFNLRIFSSNSTAMMKQIAKNEACAQPGPTSPEDRKPKVQASVGDESYVKSVLGNTGGSNPDRQKAIGMGWEPESNDRFDRIVHLARTSNPNKRNVLCNAATFFDQNGNLVPAIVQFKMLFQELCNVAMWQELVVDLGSSYPPGRRRNDDSGGILTVQQSYPLLTSPTRCSFPVQASSPL